MGELGFKEITLANWRDNDQLGLLQFRGPVDGLVGLLLEPKLNDAVPKDVRGLFEVAKGVSVYGCLFYPAFTVGLGEALRAVDAATHHLASSVGIQELGFARRLKALHQENLLPGPWAEWDNVRDLRNSFSHPAAPPILGPGQTVALLANLARMINSLFAGPGGATG